MQLFPPLFQPIEQKQLLYVKRHQDIKMQFSNYGIMSSGLFGLVLILVATFEPAAAFGPITLTLGTTAVVLTVFLRHTSWGVWGLGGSFLLWLVLEYAHSAATSRLLRLVLAAARKLGLQQLDPATSRPASPPVKT